VDKGAAQTASRLARLCVIAARASQLRQALTPDSARAAIEAEALRLGAEARKMAAGSGRGSFWGETCEDLFGAPSEPRSAAAAELLVACASAASAALRLAETTAEERVNLLRSNA